MTVEQWRRLEGIFHSALDVEKERRGAFIANACGSDAALRDEIESLLACEAEASDFLEAVAWTPLPIGPVEGWKSHLGRIAEHLTRPGVLETAAALPLILLIWSMVKDRDRTVADTVNSRAGYLWWIGIAVAVLVFRERIRDWLRRNLT